MSRRIHSLIAAATLTFGIAACTEQLESGAGCPLLCPQTPVALRDTIIEAIVVDSTLPGFPSLGFEEFPLLANRGDTLETSVIVRFDSLPKTYRRVSATEDSTVVQVDSAALVVRLAYPVDDTAAVHTIFAYDVDTVLPAESLADTMVATLLPLFTPERLLGSLTFVPRTLTDSTVRIPISNAVLLEKIQNGKRLRIGLRIEGEKSVSLRLAGQGPASSLAIRYRAVPDTLAAAPVVITARSNTPSDPLTSAALVDYQIVVRSLPVPAAPALSVGGVPGRRTYLRFDLPRGITDSTRIVRAALMLSQIPYPQSARARDTVRIFPEVLVSSGAITSLERAVRFTSRTFVVGGGVVGLGEARVVPADSAVITFDIAPLVSVWGSIASDTVPRAIVLRALDEGAGATVLFHSREAAAPGLRPRLRLTYAPSLEFGLP